MMKEIQSVILMLFIAISCLNAQVVDYKDKSTMLYMFQNNGYAPIQENGENFYINTQGERFKMFNTSYASLGNASSIEDYENETKKYPELFPKTVFCYIQKNKWGVMSPKGEILLSATYDSIDVENRYFWKLKKDGLYTYYMPDKTMFPFFEAINYLDGEYFDVKQNGKWHLYSKSKKEIITKNTYEGFDYCGGCGNRSPYVYAKKNSKWGVIDWNENILVPFEYEGYHAMMRSDNWVTAFSKNGKELIIHIPTKKEFYTGEILMGLLIQEKDGKFGAYDENAKEILPFEYDKIELPNENSYLGYYGDYLVTTKRTRQGIVSLDGNIILPNEFDEIMVYDDYFVAKKNHASYLYNQKAEELLHVDNSEITPVEDYFYSTGSHGHAIFKVKQKAYYGIYFAAIKKYIEPQFYSAEIDYIGDKESRRALITAEKNGQFTKFYVRGDSVLERSDLTNVLDEKLELLVFENDKKHGVYDALQQKEIIPAIYDEVSISTIASKKIIEGQLYNNQRDIYDGSVTHLYTLSGQEIMNHPITKRDSISIQYQLLELKDKEQGYFLWNVQNQQLTPLKYSFVFKTASPNVLMVGDNENEVKLYNVRTSKVRKEVFDRYWPYENQTPELSADERILTLFSEGLAKVYTKDGFGYVNEDGKIIIKPQYDFATDFKNGTALVLKKTSNDASSGYYYSNSNYEFGCIDTLGRFVFPMKYSVDGEHIGEAEKFLSGETLILTQYQNGELRYGLGNTKTGEILLPLEYDMVKHIPHLPYVLVQQEKKFGVANLIGEIVVPVNCDNMMLPNMEFIYTEPVKSLFPLLINSEGKWRYINEDGTYLPIVGDRAY